jgi:hypothetical protein
MVARRWAVVVLGVALVQAASASSRPILVVSAREAAHLTLTGADANTHWNQGYLRPGAAIRFTGSVTAPASLTATLRPLDRPGVVTAHEELQVTRAGPFTKSIQLPPRALPGTYSLRVGGTSGGSKLKTVEVKVAIPAPPEGVLDQAQVGTTPNGPWLLYESGTPPVLSGPHKTLWMRFRFLYPPTGKQVELVWRLHWRRLVGKVYKLYKDTLTTSVSSSTPLPSGHWSAALVIDGRIAKKMDVIVR